MEMGGLRFHEIMAISWQICHFPKRPCLSRIIAAKVRLFLTHLQPSSMWLQKREIGQSLSAIRVPNEGTLKWQWAVCVSRKYGEIAANLRDRPERPSFRARIAAKDALFLAPFRAAHWVSKNGQN